MTNIYELHDFPKELKSSAKSLKHLHCKECAWNCKKAIEVIEYLSKNGFIILGGEVYIMVDDKLQQSTGYENWYTDEDLPTQELIVSSAKKSQDYINNFCAKNGDAYYYSISFVEPERLAEFERERKYEEQVINERLRRK